MTLGDANVEKMEKNGGKMVESRTVKIKKINFKMCIQTRWC